MFNVNEKLAESPEHVPLLITPSAVASKHQKPSAATAINIPNNVTNGNGLIDSSDPQRSPQLSPVLLSSNSPAHVMRSRLNHYKVSGKFKNNVVVNFDGDNGTSVSTCTAPIAGNKKKKSVEI